MSKPLNEWDQQCTAVVTLPKLSVGLHVNLMTEDGEPVIDLTAPDKCLIEIHRQLERFQDLMGCLPTHLDSHHNIHRSPQLLPHFLDLAQQYRLPLREHSAVHYFPSFYGQWDGETHLEQISAENLAQMLESEFEEGITELSCHPGYVEPRNCKRFAARLSEASSQSSRSN